MRQSYIVKNENRKESKMQFDFLKNGINTLFGGASSEAMQHAEIVLGISLPRAIREFLSFSDGALIAEKVILFSAKVDMQNHEDLLSFNNRETVQCFLRIGRFSADEFGYLYSDLFNDDPVVYVLDHETGKYHKEADNLLELLQKYNDSQPPKKKWYSFLFN